MTKQITMSKDAFNLLTTASELGLLSDTLRNDISLALIMDVSKYNKLMSNLARTIDTLGIKIRE